MKIILKFLTWIIFFIMIFTTAKLFQLKIIKMFIRLLTKHSNLTLYLKPKSKLSLENLKNLMPIINEYIDNNRIKIFFGKGFNEKFNPAKLAKN